MCDEAARRSNGAMNISTPPPRSAEPVVAVRGLTKAYDGRTVVDHLDLAVHDGEVLGLIGANGAGKTTTVEILQGLRRQDSGEVRVLGLDPVRDADRLRQQVGSQLQSSGLPDRLRVVRGRRPVLRSPGDRRRPAAGAVRAGAPTPVPVRGPERRRAAAAVPGAGAAQPAPAGDPRRAHPGPRPGRPARRLVGDLAAPRRRYDGAAGHPRARRGRGAVRPGRCDARRAGARPGHPCRAGRPARRRGDGAVHACRTTASLPPRSRSSSSTGCPASPTSRTATIRSPSAAPAR